MVPLSRDPMDDYINSLRELARRPDPEVLRIIAECKAAAVSQAKGTSWSWTDPGADDAWR